MDYRPLGPLRVSVIGFGAWGIGGQTPGATSYGKTDDAVSRRALHEAIEQGINFFDTSSVYGDGHSEALIGELTARERDRMVIATKAGITPGYQGYDFSPASLRASLEGSLRRLRTDRVDLFQLHNPDLDTVVAFDGLGDLVERLRAEGKIRTFGISTRSPDDALTLLDRPGIDCFQVNFNLLDWRALDCGLFERAANAGKAIIARTPLAFGFIAGHLTADAQFDPSDHRSRWSREQIAIWVDAAADIFTSLGRGQSPAERAAIALQFCLSFAAVATVIPGMTTPAEVEANAAATRGALSADDLARMGAAYRRHEAKLHANKA